MEPAAASIPATRSSDMDEAALPIMDAPVTYRIRVHGSPAYDWIEAMLGDVTVTIDQTESDVNTTFIVEMVDQSSLLGFINALYNLGHAVISVEQIIP